MGRVIRLALSTDLPTLREVERAAGAAFREIGMAAIADDEPPDLDVLARYQAAGRAWVCADGDDAPVAYLLVDRVDGRAHVEQVSVHPAHSRRGLGARLLDTAQRWARREQLAGLTLTTFAEVPWNAPYYRRLGFRELADAELTPQLRALRRHEAEQGLDRWPRVAMFRDR